MPAQTESRNTETILRYTDQPAFMPDDLRDRIEAHWGGLPVQLYAIADLDDAMNLSTTWVVVGPEHVAVVSEGTGDKAREFESFERSRIKSVRMTPGLSCTVLALHGSPGEPALAVLRYTHRQRRAMENVKFVIEQQLEGLDVVPSKPDEVYSDSVAHAIKEAQASVAGNRLAVVWRLMSYLKPYRKKVIFGMIGAFVMTAVSLFPPYMTGSLIDKVIKPYQSGAIPYSAALKLAALLVGGIALTHLVREACLYVRMRSLSVLGENVARDLRHHLYAHMQKLSLSYFSSKQTGGLISRVSHDTDRLWDFIAFGVVEVVIASLTLVGLGVVLICLDRQLGLIMVVPVPFLLFSFVVHGRRMRRIFLKGWRKWSGLTSILSDTIPGIRVVKAFNQEQNETRRFSNKNADATREFNKIHAIWTKFWPLLMLCIHATTLAVWVFALPRVLNSETLSGLDLGKFVSFLLYMGMFVYPIETIGMMARMLNRATSSAHRVFEILDTEPQIVDVPDPVRIESLQGRVTFENVSFAYDGIRQVIKNVSFDVKQGEMVGLAGPSGGGKTTITNLIARFYEADDGRVLIDGVDVRELDTGQYRRQLGMVLQDPYLFHGPILDNIRYGVPEATFDKVVEAAVAANAHDFICKLPHGYDTIVGERGHTLSGGERQRVSIARAILNDPRILILDEATSSVDTETERKIQLALDHLIPGRTVFAIAHRLSTLNKANRIFVIEDGCITEQGTHAELLAEPDGAYRKLHEMQQELHHMYAV